MQKFRYLVKVKQLPKVKRLIGISSISDFAKQILYPDAIVPGSDSIVINPSDNPVDVFMELTNDFDLSYVGKLLDIKLANIRSGAYMLYLAIRSSEEKQKFIMKTYISLLGQVVKPQIDQAVIYHKYQYSETEYQKLFLTPCQYFGPTGIRTLDCNIDIFNYAQHVDNKSNEHINYVGTTL